MSKILSLLFILIAIPLRLFSQEPAASPTPKLTLQDLQVLESTLNWKKSKITLGSGLATINVPSSFRYLDPRDTDTVLERIWGNPPEQSRRTLGMIFPKELGPLDQTAWAVVITYDETGYVRDDDAEKVNYDELLRVMQGSARKANEERVRQGYPAVDIVGWAETPHYNRVSHKLYWAKEVRFEGAETNTLNYCVRDLGRRGVIQLNAVASMRSFPEIKERMPSVLAMVEFNPGNMYTDFNPSTDKVSELGLAALILGGTVAAAKFGLFKWLLPIILAGKKFVVIGIIAFVAFFRKLFGFKGNRTKVSA